LARNVSVESGLPKSKQRDLLTDGDDGDGRLSSAAIAAPVAAAAARSADADALHTLSLRPFDARGPPRRAAKG
jgi:hypothetical protein